MKRSIMYHGALGSVLVLMSVSALAQTDLYTENPAFNLSGNVNSGYSGNVGIVFSNAVPAGNTVEVTALGFYAGTPGQFTGAGTVDYNHTLSFWGPGTSLGYNFSSVNLASVTLTAGTAVDLNGFAWVSLGTPITLAPSAYYLLMTTVTSGQSTDPYLSPYDSGSGGNPVVLFTAGGPGTGVGFDSSEGAYNTTGGIAYSDSGYLGPNLQFEIVPEPSTMALGGMGLMALMVYRRRAAK